MDASHQGTGSYERTFWGDENILYLFFKKNKSECLFFNLFGCAGSKGHANSVAACGIQFPEQGSNPGPLHWKQGSLTAVPPGKPQTILYLDCNGAQATVDICPNSDTAH